MHSGDQKSTPPDADDIAMDDDEQESDERLLLLGGGNSDDVNEPVPIVSQLINGNVSNVDNNGLPIVTLTPTPSSTTTSLCASRFFFDVLDTIFLAVRKNNTQTSDIFCLMFLLSHLLTHLHENIVEICATTNR